MKQLKTIREAERAMSNRVVNMFKDIEARKANERLETRNKSNNETIANCEIILEAHNTGASVLSDDRLAVVKRQLANALEFWTAHEFRTKGRTDITKFARR